MFDHIGYAVKNWEKSADFFERALKPLGHVKLVVHAEWKTAAFGTDHPMFWIGQGDSARRDDDFHVCFKAKSRAQVDEFYRAAIAAGGSDNGPPGLRPEYHANYYGAFVFDLDGVNIEACCHAPE